MRKILITILLAALSSLLFAKTNVVIESKKNLSIGDSVVIKSKLLKENRTLNIYLPASYANNTKEKYPVIYLLDGSLNEDFIHISGLVQFGSFSWIKMLPETIVVGISNIDRKRDYTFPTENKELLKEFPTTGGSANFIEFVEQELQPFIEREYRVNDLKTIIGQSLGGLLATEILYKKPHLFNNYIIISPSLWWDDNSLFESKLPKNLDDKSIYVGVGKEGEIMEQDARKLYQKLSHTSIKIKKIKFRYFDNLEHGDTLHLAVYDAFEQIFKIKP